MRTSLIRIGSLALAVFLTASASFAQPRKQPRSVTKAKEPITVQIATTKDGRLVILKSDGTWEYTNDEVGVERFASAAEAVKALKTLASATSIGINAEEYSRRLIDVKATVEEKLKQESDAALKKEIQLALDAYVDAGQAWNQINIKVMKSGRRVLSEPTMLPDSDEFAGRLQRTYEIPTENIDPGDGATEYMRKTMPDSLKPFRVMRRDVVMRTIWRDAETHLDKAESLLESRRN